MDGLADRIGKAVAAAGGPQIVSEKLGVGLSSIYNYKNTQAPTPPPLTFLEGLAELAGVARQWLFFGEAAEAAPAPPASPEEGMWKVPIYNLEVSAGGGAFPVDQEVIGHLGFPEPELRKLGQLNELALATVKGASMEPELRDGDLVMFDGSARDMRDGIVIFRNDDAVLLKRLHVIGKGRIELLSSSPAFNPIGLQQGVDDFEVLGRVVFKLTRV